MTFFINADDETKQIIINTESWKIQPDNGEYLITDLDNREICRMGSQAYKKFVVGIRSKNVSRVYITSFGNLSYE